MVGGGIGIVGPGERGTLRPFEVAAVCKLVRERTGVVLGEGKAYVVHTRLEVLARSLGYGTARDVYRALAEQPNGGLAGQVVDSLLTKETSFFRHPSAFEALTHRVVPDILARNPGGVVRMWSAACATGQEPYSILMSLQEAGLCQGEGSLDLLASDISESALQQARSGTFRQVEIGRGLPVTLVLKYFRQDGHNYRILPELRARVRFQTADLLDSNRSVGRFDVIFCRNVGIYFSAEDKARLVKRLVSSLAPNGCLFLGASETALRSNEQVVHEQWNKAVFYRKKEE